MQYSKGRKGQEIGKKAQASSFNAIFCHFVQGLIIPLLPLKNKGEVWKNI